MANGYYGGIDDYEYDDTSIDLIGLMEDYVWYDPGQERMRDRENLEEYSGQINKSEVTGYYDISPETRSMLSRMESLINPYEESTERLSVDTATSIAKNDIQKSLLKLNKLIRTGGEQKSQFKGAYSKAGFRSGGMDESSKYLNQDITRAVESIGGEVQKTKLGLNVKQRKAAEAYDKGLWGIYSDFLSQDPARVSLVATSVGERDATEGTAWDWLTGETSVLGQAVGVVSDVISGVGSAVGNVVSDIVSGVSDAWDYVFSDEKLKKNVKRKGLYKGMPVYSYQYLWDDVGESRRVGFMSKDVKKVLPDAVGEIAGFETVNYSIVKDFLDAGGMDG